MSGTAKRTAALGIPGEVKSRTRVKITLRAIMKAAARLRTHP